MYYNALGRCVNRTLGAPGTCPLSPTTFYIYDGEKPILEYNGANVARNLYGKGIDEILMRSDPTVNGGAAFYFDQNHEGSVTLLTDTSGNVLERYRYDVFGAPTIYAPNWISRSATLYDNRFLFTGREPSEWGHREMDGQAHEGNGRAERERRSQYAATYRSTYTTAAFNFYEYRARAYNAKLGRFMSEDPKLFDAGDYNLFRYCHNDPIDNVDPMGLEENLAQKPISAWDPTGRAWLKQLHDAVQEMLRRAARERAYARAYSGGNYEGGTAYIGTTNFHMGQVSSSIRDRPSPPGFWHAQPGPDGLVPMSSEMKRLIIAGLRDANDAGNEVNKAIWVDPGNWEVDAFTKQYRFQIVPRRTARFPAFAAERLWLARRGRHAQSHFSSGASDW